MDFDGYLFFTTEEQKMKAFNPILLLKFPRKCLHYIGIQHIHCYSNQSSFVGAFNIWGITEESAEENSDTHDFRNTDITINLTKQI